MFFKEALVLKMIQVPVQRSPFSKLLVVILFVALLATGASSSFLSTNNVTEGAGLTVSCNADVVGLNQSLKGIAAAIITRKIAQDEKFQNMVGVDAIEFALGKDDYQHQVQPDGGSEWNYTVPDDSLLKDADRRYARGTINVTATSDSLQLGDAGIYRCRITTYINREFETYDFDEKLVFINNGHKQVLPCPWTIALSLGLQAVLVVLSLTSNQGG